MHEMGRTSVVKFLSDLHSTAENVAEMPTMGILDNVCSKESRRYYSILIHPHYRLVYRYTSRTLYVVGIRSNARKTKFT